MILLLGCSGLGGGNTGAPDLAAYSQAATGHEWTWRDDGGAEAPAAESLLHGLSDGGGILVRRGLRFEEGTDAGRIGVVVSGDLVLDGWSIDGTGDDTRIVLVAEGSSSGDSVVTGGVTCTMEHADAYPSYYATFEDLIVVDCGEVELAFANEVGLVGFVTPEVTLDLVAPY